MTSWCLGALTMFCSSFFTFFCTVVYPLTFSRLCFIIIFFLKVPVQTNRYKKKSPSAIKKWQNFGCCNNVNVFILLKMKWTMLHARMATLAQKVPKFERIECFLAWGITLCHGNIFTLGKLPGFDRKCVATLSTPINPITQENENCIYGPFEVDSTYYKYKMTNAPQMHLVFCSGHGPKLPLRAKVTRNYGSWWVSTADRLGNKPGFIATSSEVAINFFPTDYVKSWHFNLLHQTML